MTRSAMTTRPNMPAHNPHHGASHEAVASPAHHASSIAVSSGKGQRPVFRKQFAFAIPDEDSLLSARLASTRTHSDAASSAPVSIQFASGDALSRNDKSRNDGHRNHLISADVVNNYANRNIEARNNANRNKMILRNKMLRELLESKKRAKFIWFDLPQELRERIISLAVTHHNPIPVDTKFRRADTNYRPPGGYGIVHTCVLNYNRSLYLYYGNNAFSIDLQDFRYFHTSHKGSWLDHAGYPGAKMHMRSLHLRARHSQLDFVYAIRCILGFDSLDKIVFDTRDDSELDMGPDGVKTSGSYQTVRGSRKNQRIVNVSMKLVEVEVTKDSYLGQVLKKAGVRVGSGGIWVGGVNKKDAKRQMEGNITTNVLRSFEQLVELRGPGEGLQSSSEYLAQRVAQMGSESDEDDDDE